MLLSNMKFSILIPAYKQKYLQECINSILWQSYEHFELIIVDDASPEDLYSIVSLYSDPRIKYYRNKKNCGAVNVVDNWNICLGYATGDYVICMGDDDKLLPNCLEEYVKLIAKHPGIGLLHGWTEIIDENSITYQKTVHRCEYESVTSLIWHRWYAYNQQFIGDFCFESAWLREQGGFYFLPLAWGSDDISAFIGASKNGVANTQSIVFQYRRNPYTISSTGNVEMKLEAVLEEYKWYKAFLCQEPDNQEDILYHKELVRKLDVYFQKKLGYNLSNALKNSKLSAFIWMFRSRKYNISFKAFIYALSEAFK